MIFPKIHNEFPFYFNCNPQWKVIFVIIFCCTFLESVYAQSGSSNRNSPVKILTDFINSFELHLSRLLRSQSLSVYEEELRELEDLKTRLERTELPPCKDSTNTDFAKNYLIAYMESQINALTNALNEIITNGYIENVVIPSRFDFPSSGTMRGLASCDSAPIEEGYAEITIVSAPDNAEIFINEKFVGIAPIEIIKPIGEELEITAMKLGYQTKKMMLRVKRNDNQIMIPLIRYNAQATEDKNKEGYLEPSEKKAYYDLLKNGQKGPAIVYVPKGSFMMGSMATEFGRDEDEKIREIALDHFFIGLSEVSIQEFMTFVNSTGYVTDAEKNSSKGCSHWVAEVDEWKYVSNLSWKSPGYEQELNDPVVCISYSDIAAYMEWLSEETGYIYRLPTEAEWEYAARAGNPNYFTWGNNIDAACDYANVADRTRIDKFGDNIIHDCVDGFLYTSPIYYFRPNKWGLRNVVGNVWEITCSDFDKRYIEGRGCDFTDQDKVIRGGSWYSAPHSNRLANREFLGISDRDSEVGFRILREIVREQ